MSDPRDQGGTKRVEFAGYEFDLATLCLTRDRRPVPLRPKVGVLLRALLQSRGRVVSKGELMQVVWGSRRVEEHSLFQLVSLIRKLAPNATLIRTHPNRGYEWVCPVRASDVSTDGLYRWPIAAVVVMGLAAVLLVAEYVGLGSQPAPSTSISPALSALHHGLNAGQRGDVAQATIWFEFAQAEDPESAQPRLLLAQAALWRGDIGQAIDLAQSVIDATTYGDYEKMSAWRLMGEAQLAAGEVDSAVSSIERVLALRPPEGGGRCMLQASRSIVQAIVSREPDHRQARRLLATLPAPPPRSSSAAPCGLLQSHNTASHAG